MTKASNLSNSRCSATGFQWTTGLLEDFKYLEAARCEGGHLVYDCQSTYLFRGTHIKRSILGANKGQGGVKEILIAGSSW